MIKICLIPLDERPVNTRYPQMLAAIAGADIVLPPKPIRGLQRKPSDIAEVQGWLKNTVIEGVDAVIVSVDYLVYGNLINARISKESAVDAIGRVAILEEIGAKIPVHAFSLITRVSNANDNVEEPIYWKQWGTQFYRYARLQHRSEVDNLGIEEGDELDALSAKLPEDLKADWLTRRLRNHAVNLALVDLAMRGKIESLLLTSDDTAEFGFPTRERNWLKSWLDLIGGNYSSRIQMHPGADEVGSALLAKLVNQNGGVCPKVWIEYAIADDKNLVAPYEDRPVRETVLGQIEACGCMVANDFDQADFVLGVVTPSPRGKDYHLEYLDGDRASRGEEYSNFLQRLGEFQKQGKPIALADVAYPNGSDRLFDELLMSDHSTLRPGNLCAYGAWNTAGNALGVVVAQAACSLLIDGDPVRELAQRKFVAHRFLEDCGYQQYCRRRARDFCEATFATRDPNPESQSEVDAVAQFIEGDLIAILGDFQAHRIGVGLRIVPGSVWLPWNRTFEVDFELESV